MHCKESSMFKPILCYIDPMSGAIVLQVIVAAVVGTLAFFRRRVWSLFQMPFRLKRSGATEAGDHKP
jgi:hypothetical protein